MAYAALYEFNFLSTNGKDILIRINADGYVGSVKSRHVGGAPQLRLEQNGNIKGMSLEFPAECEIEDEYASLYTSNPYKFLVELEVESTVVWRGFITPELYSSPWVDPPYDVTLTATDGLGELKMHTFPALGRQTLEAFFATLLGATGLNLPIKAINTAYNDVISTDNLLADTTVNLDDMAGQSYYDVLDALLTSIHATIQQSGSEWLIIRETDITSMTEDDEVSDTSGMTYPIVPFGSMQANDVWPVGRLRMEIVPAKNSVKVSAANHFFNSILLDPEMMEGRWSGDGMHFTTDGGFYALNNGQTIYQDFVPESADAESFPDFFEWRFKYRQSGDGEAVLRFAVQVTGIDDETGQETVLSWLGTDNGQNGRWDNSVSYMRGNVGSASHGNSADCEEATIKVQAFGVMTSWFSRIDRIRFIFISLANTIYIHHSSVATSSLVNGVNTRLILNNDARGAAPDVEPVFADTYVGNHGLPFMTNSVYGKQGSVSSLVETWGSDSIPSLPYGEWLAKDNAFSVATPRLRLQGKLNMPADRFLPAFFYSTGGMNYLCETYDFDLLNDEAEVSLLSLPAAAIQVVSVRQTAYGEDGYEVDSAVSVFPASFNIPADDTTTRYYIAVSAPAAMSWTVEDIPNWITIDSQSGTGSGTVSFLATLNAGIARQALMMVAGIPVSIYQNEAGGEHSLTFNISPSDGLTITMTIDGETAVYSAGMMVESGKVVNVTISKQGYSTLNDSFNMPGEDTIKYYTLSENIEATITPVSASITQPSQNVIYTISDASGHGWTLDYGGPSTFNKITGGGVTSGSATAGLDVIRGTGNAVVYLTVEANENYNNRSINEYPFQFKDTTTNATTSLSIMQLGTSSSQVLVTGITLNKTSLSLPKGSNQTLTATVLPSNATNKNVVWSSSNTSKVQVGQDGTVYAIDQGTASVRATASDGSGVYATCSVSVLDATVPVTGVTVSPSSLSLAIGRTSTVTAVITPQNASNKAVTWRTTASTIATIDQYGVVTGVGKGACRVYATTLDGGFESYCSINVTNSSSMSATNVTAKAAATSGSSVLTVSGVSPSSIHASTTATWVTGVTVDTSGRPYRVRLTFGQNASSTRTATITVTGTGTSGEIGTTFVLTQNAPSTSDVPVNSMTIVGSGTIQNMKNESTYTIDFDPATTTQNKVTWSIVGGTGYAYVVQSTDTSCLVRVFSQANGQTVTLTATNYYNGEIVATKEIVVSYMEPSPNVGVNPASVIVEATATTDNTPIVTSGDLDVNTFTASVVGFVQSARMEQGRVVTTFGQNTGSTARDGQVILYSGSTRVAIINYTQEAAAIAAYGIDIEALNVYTSFDSLGKPICFAMFRVAFSNPNTYDEVVANPYATLVGYDGNGNVVLTKGWQLEDKIVAAISTEQEVYTEQWQGVLPTIDHYTITITSSTVTDSYTGTGDDIIA